MRPQDAFHATPRRGAQMRRRLEPMIHPGSEWQSSEGGIYPVAASLLRLLASEEPLRVRLPLEALTVLASVRAAIAGNPTCLSTATMRTGSGAARNAPATR